MESVTWPEASSSEWVDETYTPEHTEDSATDTAVEGRGEADLPSDGGEGPPARTVIDEYCPYCMELIRDEDTCRIRGILWHLSCYDDLVWEDTR